MILSLAAATGATVQGALSVSGNCSVGGQLIVQGTKALDALNNAASSTAPIGIADVTGLSSALAGKQAVLSAASSLQLESLQCSRLKAAAGQSLQLSDSAGVVQLGLAIDAATFLRTVSAPSLDVSGSILCSGSALFGGPLYIGSTNVAAAIANIPIIGTSSQLSVASVTCTGDISARDVTATRELHVDGAAVLNSTLTVAGTNVMSAIT